jgi:hypothetical protein
MYGGVCAMRVALPFSAGVAGGTAGGVAGGTPLGFASNHPPQNTFDITGSTGYTPVGDELSIPVTMGLIRDRLSP